MALFDFTLLSTLPYKEALDEALRYVRPLRNGNLPAEDLQILASLPEYITKSLTMYWNVWVSVAATRFSLYGAISFFIYQGRSDSFISSSYQDSGAREGLDRLKNRVVFTFCFMEMMTWFWVSSIPEECDWEWQSIPILSIFVGALMTDGLFFFLQIFATLRQERQERLTKLLEDAREEAE